MGFVIQMQRRAIEALKPFAEAPWPTEALTKEKISFFLGKDGPSAIIPPLVCLGFSEGIGTCSDIHGMYVAVMGHREWDWDDTKNPSAQQLARCAYAVLLWPGYAIEAKVLEHHDHDVRRIKLDHDLQAPRSTVELLKFESFRTLDFERPSGTEWFTHICLVRTGLIKSYVNL